MNTLRRFEWFIFLALAYGICAIAFAARGNYWWWRAAFIIMAGIMFAHAVAALAIGPALRLKLADPLRVALWPVVIFTSILPSAVLVPWPYGTMIVLACVWLGVLLWRIEAWYVRVRSESPTPPCE